MFVESFATGAALRVLASPTRARWGVRLRTLIKLARLHLLYIARHNHRLRLDNPQTFTQWVQWRKLYDHDQRQPSLADKVAVKSHVAAILGSQWVTPTYWHGTKLPDNPQWPLPFVVKSRHGCNQYAFIRTGNEDWSAICKRAAKWQKKIYGHWLDEWLYLSIPRGIIVEPFIGSEHNLPLDYKLYVFGGRVEAIQVHLDRENNHRWILLDRNWHRISALSTERDPAKPVSLLGMIGAAEKLGAGFDFIRADFYEIEGKPRFGEITFYPGSGLDPFDPPALDQWLGKLWTDARG